ncbi:MAG TPA: universal stress protein [Methanomassiliicoccales archaeon]|jgi:nucleotide-binding universal stress UspA family protein
MSSEIKRILVGIDGSSNSNRAASLAAQVAKKFDAKVTLLFVVSPSDHDMLAGKSTYIDEEKGFGEQRMEKAKMAFAEAGITFDTDIEFGNAAEKILTVSERGYDLVVVGTRGLSAIRGFLMGSVSSQVSQHSKVPVMVVP